jgi:dTDP-4-dehydrorhamnose 3,5-epimerase
MRLRPTPLEGAVVIEPERLADERGFFARTYDVADMPAVVQMSVSFNATAGTLRGLHFQAEPHGESKLVRCTRGAIFDVAVDLRAASATWGAWHGVELTEDNGLAFLLPAGFAHGFQTLVDETEVLYAMDAPFVPGAGRGVRWNDLAFGITWPDPPAAGRTMSERDATYPDVQR